MFSRDIATARSGLGGQVQVRARRACRSVANPAIFERGRNPPAPPEGRAEIPSTWRAISRKRRRQVARRSEGKRMFISRRLSVCLKSFAGISGTLVTEHRTSRCAAAHIPYAETCTLATLAATAVAMEAKKATVTRVKKAVIMVWLL